MEQKYLSGTLRLIYAAVCLSLCLVLPFLTGQIPEIGSKLSPMHHSGTSLWLSLWMAVWACSRRDCGTTTFFDLFYAAISRVSFYGIRNGCLWSDDGIII